jgi:hypothetical protein
MFYEACLTAGVNEMKSKVMYAAVYFFGARWPAPGEGTRGDASLESLFDQGVTDRLMEAWRSVEGAPRGTSPLAYDRGTKLLKPTVQISEAELAAITAAQEKMLGQYREWIEESNPTLDEIEEWSAPR